MELGALGALGEDLEDVFHDNDELIVNVEDLQALRVGTGGTGRPRGGTGGHWGALGGRKSHWEVE